MKNTAVRRKSKRNKIPRKSPPRNIKKISNKIKKIINSINILSIK